MATGEQLPTTVKRLQKIFDTAQRDVRFTLNMMQVNLLSKDLEVRKPLQATIFDSVQHVFDAEASLEDKEEWCQLQPPELMLAMVQHNAARHLLGTGLSQLQHLADSAAWLSDAQLAQHVQPDLETTCVLAATRYCHKKTGVQLQMCGAHKSQVLFASHKTIPSSSSSSCSKKSKK